MTFADTLKQHSIDTWQKILSNCFVRELSNEILPINKFVFYLRQDHYFLEEFSKFLHSAKQKTEDSNMREWLDSLYLNTVNSEMEMQKQLLDSLCVSSGSASNATAAKYDFPPSRTTLNYAYYLMDISSSGTFSEIMSVMAPCPWTYLDIAQELSKNTIRNEAYRKWIQFYSSTESLRQVTEIKDILNRVGEKVDEKSRAKMKYHFVNACKYEYFFWEMAYNLGG